MNSTHTPFFRTIVALKLLIVLAGCPNGIYAQENGTATDTSDAADGMPQKESILADRPSSRGNPIKSYEEAYFLLKTPPRALAPGIGLQTPQAALENFIINARNDRFWEASYSLDLKLLPENLSREEITMLSRKLYYVINQKIHINWEDLPDRADGQVDLTTNANKAIAGKPQKSILFGRTSLGERDISFRVERVKSEGTAPIWLISASTVENIEPMYAQYGPKRLDRILPQWSRMKFLGVSLWKVALFLMFLTVSYLLFRASLYIFGAIHNRSDGDWVKNASLRLSSPTSFAMGVLLFYVLLNSFISFNSAFARYLNIALLISVVIAFTWLITRILDTVMLHYAEQRLADTTKEENDESRTLMTYISVARRIITFLVIIIGLMIILSQFRSFQKLGISLLASAGVATVVLGIAAQSTLGNIIAGIQIAITKPARIGDTVIMNDEWGFVEDIGFTSMIVRTWDERRLVVPLKRIISETFENWSLKNPKQIKPIDLYVDYQMDVDILRSEFKDLLKASALWDHEQEPSIQVIDATEKSMKVRALCSAKDSYAAWDLHCILREGLIKYLGALENGSYLARSRHLILTDKTKDTLN